MYISTLPVLHVVITESRLGICEPEKHLPKA